MRPASSSASSTAAGRVPREERGEVAVAEQQDDGLVVGLLAGGGGGCAPGVQHFQSDPIRGDPVTGARREPGGAPGLRPLQGGHVGGTRRGGSGIEHAQHVEFREDGVGASDVVEVRVSEDERVQARGTPPSQVGDDNALAVNRRCASAGPCR